MSRLFFDSSVLFSAAYSTRGHAYDLIGMAIRRELTAVISALVLTETRRNLAESAPEYLALLDYILNNVPFELVRPTRREVVAATQYTALKDAPIVAAARKAKIDFLVTLD
ncbi:MAG TPA: PIN domain-containing protein [Anaerolineae bacterium]